MEVSCKDLRDSFEAEATCCLCLEDFQELVMPPVGTAREPGNRGQLKLRLLLALDSQNQYQGDCLLQGTFLIHMASSCLLAANGSVMGFDFTLAFNKNQLVCYESDTQCFVACDWGLLRLQATHLAAHLNNDSTWVQRVEAQRQACSDLALRYWDWTALRRTQPQVRIIPAETGNARVPVCLTCHIWGFYPPEETVIWLRNRDILEPDGYNPISAIPNGNWTYQTQVSLMLMVVGLGLFLAGVYRFRARPPAPGYTPLPGENYPKGSI
nr:HLA class II histocompatibility antigen, DM beta chain-like [Anser cygnoides]